MSDVMALIRGFFDQPLMAELSTAFIVGLVGFVVIRTIQAFIIRAVPENATRYRIRKFVGFAGYLTLFLVCLSVFNDRIGEFSVILGVAGAGIAFALQEVIASLAGWIAISVGSFYRTGDRVQLGGITGDVIDIGVLRTTLMETGDWIKGDLYNGRIVRVANSFVFKEPVYNYTDDFSFLWDEVVVPVRHGCDWRLAKRLIEDAVNEVVDDVEQHSDEAWQSMLDKYHIDETSFEPVVTVAINENWLEFTARYVVNYKARRGTKNKVTQLILDKLSETEGKITLGRTTREIIPAPDQQQISSI